MMRIKERQKDEVTLIVSGTLDKNDYEWVVPQIEKMVEDHGKIRALVELNNFGGWTPSALVDELRFDIRHRHDIERMAILGESRPQDFLVRLVAPLFEGELRFFHKRDIAEARKWLSHDVN